MAGNEKPKIQQCPPAPTQSKVESKSELKKLSETLKIDSLVGSLSDAVGKPLLKGLDKAKEFGKSIESEYYNLKVNGLIHKNQDFKKALELFIPDQKTREDYISTLVAISKNIDNKEFDEFINELNSYARFYNLDGEKRGYNIVRNSSGQKFAEKGNIFKIDQLKKLLEISPSIAKNFSFIAEKYLQEPHTNEPCTASERKAITDGSESFIGRSFTLAEMQDLFSKHGQAAKTIINFIDEQRMHRDFKNRKKFILSHLDQFKKIEPYFSDKGRREVDYGNVNLDILEKGDHMKIIVKLLDDKIIYSICEPSFDRDYIKKYAAKLIEISKNVGVQIDLPTKYEMTKNGDLLVEIAKNSHAMPYKGEGLPGISSLDKNIFEKFAWASGSIFSLDKDEKKEMLKKIEKPENRKLLSEFSQLYNETVDQFEKSFGQNSPKDLTEHYKKVLKYKFALGLSLILTDNIHDDEFKKQLVDFTEAYRKHPRIVAALQGRSFTNTEPFLFPENINKLTKIIDSSVSDGKTYEKICEILEWIPSLRDWMNDPTSYDKKANKSADSLKELLNSKWAIDLIHSNRDFIKSYLEKTGVIDFHSPSFLPELIEKFPLQFLAGSKNQLLELSKKYDKIVLRRLFFHKIKTPSDLEFFIKNGEKLSAWFSLIEKENPEKDIFASIPSIYLLENHFPELVKLMDNTEYGKGDRVFAYFQDEAFIKKHEDLFFFFINQAETIDLNVAGLYELQLTLTNFEPSINRNKDKIKWIFSSPLAKQSFTSMVRLFDNLMRKNYNGDDDDHKGVLDEKWEYLKPLIEELNKYGNQPGDFIDEYLWHLIDKTSTVSNNEQIDQFKNIIKLYRICNTDIPDNTAYQFERSLDESLGKNGKKVSEIIEDFFDENGEPPAKSDKSYSGYLKKLNNLRRSLPELFNIRKFSSHKKFLEKTLRENSGHIDNTDLHVINILKLNNCEDKIIEKYLEEAEKDYMDDAKVEARQCAYLLKDPVTNEDLGVFNHQKIEFYEKLFNNLRTANLTLMEEKIINSLGFEKFNKEMSSKSIFEIENIINVIVNRTDPRLGEILFRKTLLPIIGKNPVIGKTLAGWSAKNAEGKIKIDVTQNNLAKINSILRILNGILDVIKAGDATNDKQGLAKSIVTNIKMVFPNFTGTGNAEADIKWLFEKFDVEEINFKKLDSLAEFIEFQQLLSSMEKSDIKSSVRYLENKFKDIDFSKMSFEGVDYSIFEIQKIENLRALINDKGRLVGDMLVDMIGSRFLETNCCDYTNIGKLIKFAHAWENPGLERDINGLYQVYSTYAFVEIAGFLKENLERDKSDKNREEIKKKLEKVGVNLDEIIKELEDKNYLTLTESNAQKAISNLKKGFVGYTFRKGVSKVFGGDSLELDGRKIEIKESDWSKRNGVKVFSLSSGQKEIAKLIKCDPRKIKVKVLAEASGMVNMEKEAENLGRKLIFSAPLTFTTGARKMTELAFRDGIQMNYLLSPYTKDGFLLVNKSGEQKVLNKKRLKISDLISKEDFQNGEIKDLIIRWAKGSKIEVDETRLEGLLDMPLNPVQKFLDKKTFFELLRLKQYSLLGGMLLIDKHEGKDEGTVNKLKDGVDSRRFYLQFEDGQFGILDSTEAMSSAQMVDLALSVGATKAIYMDTGMYDMAAYQDGSGQTHIMGHQDTSESTNRVVIYEQ